MTRLLDRDTVRGLLDWPEIIGAVREAYRTAAVGHALAPASSHLDLPAGALHLKAGGTREPALLSVKANLRPDQAPASGVILLFDTESTTLRAVLDSADITACRTAAAAAVAARALGAPDGGTLAVLGAGPVAAATLAAFRHELGVRKVHVWSRSGERARALDADEVHDEPGSAARVADIVVTCTPSRAPLIGAGDLREGTVVCAMGADSPGKRELATDLLEAAEVVSDNLPAARQVGETAALPADFPGVVGQIGDLLAGTVALPGTGRWRVFDSVGVAHADTAVAAAITVAAERAGLGLSWTPGSD
jgi:ornithine cyclodeaminase/alanine dehydrogenase-like protein (mu-crystallin family)